MNLRRIFTITALLLVVLTVAAETKQRKYYRHEIGVSSGLGVSIDNSFEKYQEHIREQYYYLGEGGGWFRSILLIRNIHYYYNFNRRLAVGGSLSYTSSEEYFGYSEYSDVYIHGQSRMKQSSYIIMPEIKWIWTDYRYMRLYMRGGCGLYMQTQRFKSDFYDSSILKRENRTVWMPAYQISPLGIEIGSNRLCFFTEMGYGLNGILQMGLIFRFITMK